MKVIARLPYTCVCSRVHALPQHHIPEAASPGEELARMAGVSGHHGGHLTIGQRSEPKDSQPGYRDGRRFTGGDRAASWRI